ncbi:BlaI/MecI/CopY family transcriptional regulator [Actinoplanes sp. NPDC026619]|uniref:BlaI/MecI/CopY family transcriptional regulator n=1 Tax=Actinoplanes sp. NPDC026619 TaxID=3155798 RepID=UPI00340DC4AE
MSDEEAGPRRARGALESEVMAALWAAGEPLTPAGVQSALSAGLAYNTVQTILIRLLEKDLVRRGPAGRGSRGHAYWPAQDAATLTAARMRAALDERPDRQAVLQQFAAGLEADDVETLRSLLAERDA